MQKKSNLVVTVGGPAGYGIFSVGEILGKALTVAGAYVNTYVEYPSLIKGGHNFFQVRISDRKIQSFKESSDILIAFDDLTIQLHKDETKLAIIYDKENSKYELDKGIDIPFKKILRELKLHEIVRNNVALGAITYLIGIDPKIVKDVIKKMYKGKEELAKEDLLAFDFGFNYASKHYDPLVELQVIKKQEQAFLNGNDAISLGALKAGLKFYAAYPMTPATSILTYLAKKQEQYKLLVLQPEDEISAIHMAIGASYTGIRSMVATSGGGFALMNEAISLAAQTETPIVIVLVQRPAPATGLPTKQEQGDLNFALNAGHGEFPKLVIAPGTLQQCFELTFKAFNLAEKYQMPTIIISDKHLATTYQSIQLDLFKQKLRNKRENIIQKAVKDYKRYEFTKTGVSKRAFPGLAGCIHVSGSNEHDEYGFITDKPELRQKMHEKRFRKVSFLLEDIDDPYLYGNKNSDTIIVSWGSPTMTILDALYLLRVKDAIEPAFMQLAFLMPFKAKKVGKILDKYDKKIIIENNFTGQLASLIKKETGHEFNHKILKYDGRPFSEEYIYRKLKQLLK